MIEERGISLRRNISKRNNDFKKVSKFSKDLKISLARRAFLFTSCTTTLFVVLPRKPLDPIFPFDSPNAFSKLGQRVYEHDASTLINIVPQRSPPKLLSRMTVKLTWSSVLKQNTLIHQTCTQLAYFSGKLYRLIISNVAEDVARARGGVFTRANESEYDSFCLSLSRSSFSLFLGLDRLAAEQGPCRKRKGVYIPGRSGEDEVKSDFPSVPSRYTRVPG